MYVTAIILAAGKNLRLKSKVCKPLIKINSKPLIIYCLRTLSKHPDIKDIIIVANNKNLKDIISILGKYGIKKIRGIVLGGKRRQDSVINGLKAIYAHTDLVLIHDGVRPFIDNETLSCVIKEAKKSGAAIVGVPVKATIKAVESQPPTAGTKVVKKTLDRSNLWEVQTPQVFKKDLILKAYERYGNVDVTDDAMLVEKLGVEVGVVLGSYSNIKITTPEDLIIAEAISKKL